MFKCIIDKPWYAFIEKEKVKKLYQILIFGGGWGEGSISLHRIEPLFLYISKLRWHGGKFKQFARLFQLRMKK